MELTRVINLSERYIERNVNLAKQEANLFSQFGVVSGVPFRHGDRSPWKFACDVVHFFSSLCPR